MTSHTPAIEITELTLGFGAEVLCADLTLSVPCGHKVIVCGRSGSGKSTFLKALLGFVRPLHGDIKIQGKALHPDSVWTLRREMAYLAQEPDLGTGRVKDCVLRPFGYRINRRCTPSDKRIDYWFERFFLSHDLQTKDISVLSGGQKQRVAFIIAILLERSIFLLDEPISALDQFSKTAVAEYIHQIDDKTVLWVSHEASVYESADQVVNLDHIRRGEVT